MGGIFRPLELQRGGFHVALASVEGAKVANPPADASEDVAHSVPSAVVSRLDFDGCGFARRNDENRRRWNAWASWSATRSRGQCDCQ